MMTYLPSILAALVGVAAVFAAPVQEYIAHHPAIAAVVAALAAILTHFLPSPRK